MKGLLEGLGGQAIKHNAEQLHRGTPVFLQCFSKLVLGNLVSLLTPSLSQSSTHFHPHPSAHSCLLLPLALCVHTGSHELCEMAAAGALQVCEAAAPCKPGPCLPRSGKWGTARCGVLAGGRLTLQSSTCLEPGQGPAGPQGH